MNLEEIRKQAKENLKGYCRVCPVCDGRACAGEVPGMGGLGTGQAFQVNLTALRRYRLRMRAVHGVKEPQTSLSLWGRSWSLPLMAAPMTGTTYNMGGQISEQEFIDQVISGSAEAGSFGFSGDGADPAMFDSGISAIHNSNGLGIPIIKPRAQEEIVKRIRSAEEAGAMAVGVDIDGAGLVTMALKGQAVGPKDREEIRELVQSTDLPFILKGVMTAEDALSALEAGVSAIVVSNHGGRVLDHTPGAAEVLQEISELVGGRMTVFADGGVRSGSDVLKLLALGADAVLLGRPLITGAFGGGRDGVKLIMEKYGQELIQAMLLTGVPDVTDVSPRILDYAE